MQITFLGTASAFPLPRRGVSCTALRLDDGAIWLFDCGEGSQIQLQKSSLKPGRITKIFITHLHGDHLFGLPGILCSLATLGAEKKDFTVEVFGPQGLRKYLRQSLNLSRSPLVFFYVVHELIPIEQQYPKDWDEWKVDHTCEEPMHPQEKPGQDIVVGENHVWDVFTDDKVSVKAGVILHRVPTFGYVILEKDLPGTLNVKLLEKMNVKPGPLCNRLKNGETVTFPNGITVEPSEVLGPAKRGRKVTILGDTYDPYGMTDLARNSDILIHEATLENALKEKAIEVGHSTPAMAVQFAQSIGARILVLNHFSQRYKPENENCGKESSVMQLLENAKEALGVNKACEVILAEDFKVVDVPRNSCCPDNLP